MHTEGHTVLTVDCVVFNAEGELLLIQRKYEPFKGKYALPGGMVEYGEDTESAALRELKEETGIQASTLELIGVYSQPGRDPRGHYVSVAYLVSLEEGAQAMAGDDAASLSFVKDWRTQDLAFDHRQILEDALMLHTIQ